MGTGGGGGGTYEEIVLLGVVEEEEVEGILEHAVGICGGAARTYKTRTCVYGASSESVVEVVEEEGAGVVRVRHVGGYHVAAEESRVERAHQPALTRVMARSVSESEVEGEIATVLAESGKVLQGVVWKIGHQVDMGTALIRIVQTWGEDDRGERVPVDGTRGSHLVELIARVVNHDMLGVAERVDGLANMFVPWVDLVPVDVRSIRP